MADPKAEKADVVLVGAGIMSATLASPGAWTAVPAMLDVMQRYFGHFGDRLAAGL